MKIGVGGGQIGYIRQSSPTGAPQPLLDSLKIQSDRCISCYISQLSWGQVGKCDRPSPEASPRELSRAIIVQVHFQTDATEFALFTSIIEVGNAPEMRRRYQPSWLGKHLTFFPGTVPDVHKRHSFAARVRGEREGGEEASRFCIFSVLCSSSTLFIGTQALLLVVVDARLEKRLAIWGYPIRTTCSLNPAQGTSNVRPASRDG